MMVSRTVVPVALLTIGSQKPTPHFCRFHSRNALMAHRCVASFHTSSLAHSDDVNLTEHGSFRSANGKTTATTTMKHYHVSGTTTNKNRSGTTVSTSTGHTMVTDLPKKMGGQDEAAQPIELFLASFIGCTQATALYVGRRMSTASTSSFSSAATSFSSASPSSILIDRMEFNIHAIRDERGSLALPIDHEPPVPARILEINGTVTVYVSPPAVLTKEQLHFLHEQTELRCPVANMIMASGCPMNVEWIDGNR
jgi:uncharacterized OsmC-like protein